MEKVEPELEGILANDEEEDDLENCELVEEVCSTSCDEEPGELSHDSPQIVNIQDLGSDHAADPDGGDPHDGGDHLHDDLVQDSEELDNTGSLLSNSTEEDPESQAEDDNAEHVG